MNPDTSPRPKYYRPDIDGLRAIAVLAVLGFHSEIRAFAGGFAGVDVFFVISGFLITGIILDALESGTFSFREFYARRANRILPALLLVLLVTAGVGWVVLFSAELKDLGRHIKASAFFSANFLSWSETGYFDSRIKPLLHLWSLAVEEQFYLVWPVALVAMWRSRIRLRWPLIVVVLLSLQFSIVQSHGGYGGAAFYSPFSRFWEIGFGAFLALDHRHVIDGEKGKAGREIAALVGLLCLALTFFLIKSTRSWPGAWALLPVGGTAFLVWAGPATQINKLLGNKVLVAIGLVSYPLYLWHLPLWVFARLVYGGPLGTTGQLGIAVLSAVLAFLTYQFLERPIRFGPRKRRSAMFLAGGLAGMTVVGIALANVVKPRAENDPAIESGFTSENWTYPGGGFDELDKLKLNTVPGDSSRKVVLIGDSHMEMYWPRFVELHRLNPANPQVIFATHAACPTLPGTERAESFGGPKSRGCAEFLHQAFELAESPRVKTVVIANFWEHYLDHPDVRFGAGNRMLRPNGPETDSAFNNLGALVARLRGEGKRVILILSNPDGPWYHPDSIFALRRLPGASRRVSSSPASRQMLKERTAVTDRQLHRIARESGAELIDPFDYLCNSTGCAVVGQNGKPLYLDDHHFRAGTARHLTFLDLTVAPNEAR